MWRVHRKDPHERRSWPNILLRETGKELDDARLERLHRAARIVGDEVVITLS